MLTRSFRGHRSLAAACLAVGALMATLLMPVRADALILNRLTITQVGTPPPVTPGAREWVADAGEGVNVTVRVSDLLFKPVVLLVPRQLKLTTTGPDSGTFSYVKTLPAGQSSVTFTGVTWNTPYDGVTLTVEATSGFIQGDTATGNVVGETATVPANTPAWNFDDTTINTTTDNCTANAQHPTCAGLRARATTPQQLSITDCDGTDGCLPGSSIVTWLADVNPNIVTRSNPNKFRIELDKSVVGGGCDYYYESFYCYPHDTVTTNTFGGDGGYDGGYDGGNPDYQVRVQLVPDTPFETAQPCPSATTVGAGQLYCLANLFFDNGDLVAILNWIQDGRVIIKT